MIGIAPCCGVGALIAGSTASGGQITPLDRASFSPSGFIPYGVGTFTSPPCPIVACVSACAQAQDCSCSAFGATDSFGFGGDCAKATADVSSMRPPRVTKKTWGAEAGFRI